MKGVSKVLLAFAAVGITVVALWFANRAVTSKEATWEDVLAEAKSGGYRLTTTEELWELYQKGPGNLLLVDTRQEWEYRTGHIKSAVNFPIEPTWWSRWRKQAALEDFLGPDKERFIAFY